MGCSSGLAKVILVLFNTIIVLISVACVGVGIFVVVNSNTFFSLLSSVTDKISNSSSSDIAELSRQTDLVKATAFVLIGLGSFILLISILGCIGACLESKCMLVTYATFIGLLAAAKIALVVVGFLQRSNLENITKDSLKKLQDEFFLSVNEVADVTPFNQYPKELKIAVTQLINYLQVSLDCCGAETNKDIARSPSWLASNRNWTNNQLMKVPATCCPIKADKKGDLLGKLQFYNIKQFLEDENCPVSQNGVHTKICFQAAVDLISRYLWISVGVFGGLILTELLLIIFALCIVCSSRDEKINRRY